MDVAIVLHHGRPQARVLALEAIEWLESNDHHVRVPKPDAEACDLQRWAYDESGLGDEIGLALSLGGDGTMLRAVDLAAPGGAPVLGVNLGHLGYLTQVSPDAMVDSLEKFFAGEHSIESRLCLEVRIEVAGEPALRRLALNEAVVEKVASGQTVSVGVDFDEEAFTTYVADGLIVATPTGSTAYNLSVRGPILSPRVNAILLSPVAPHMLFDRTMVVTADTSIRMKVKGPNSAAVVIDGQSQGGLGPGDSITCRAAPRPAQIVTIGEWPDGDFHRRLKAKFGLADR